MVQMEQCHNLADTIKRTSHIGKFSQKKNFRLSQSNMTSLQTGNHCNLNMEGFFVSVWKEKEI